jgi:hypothetical protein
LFCATIAFSVDDVDLSTSSLKTKQPMNVGARNSSIKIIVIEYIGIKHKSLILAQIERWRHALHMQVERQHGSNPGGEWRTGE